MPMYAQRQLSSMRRVPDKHPVDGLAIRKRLKLVEFDSKEAYTWALLVN